MRATFFPAILAALLISTIPGRAADPKFVGESRLVLQQVAAEPDIVTPTGVAVDAKGRIWVIENHTHQRPANYQGPAGDRIRLLDDFDPKTGKARRVRTAIEGFRNSMGLAFNDEGRLFLATRAALYELLLAADGETVTGKKEIVKLETRDDYPHNGLSGFAFDGVGHMLFSLGENHAEAYVLKGSDGKTLKGGGEGGSIYRCKPDGSGLQRVATGFWNPFAMAFDPMGNLFAVDNDPDSRGPCRLLHIIDGGDYGFRYRYGRKGLHPFVCWNGELPGTLPMVAGTLEAPSGILCYEGNYLPKDYLGKLFVTSWGDHVVEVFETKPKDSSFAATSKILLRGDDQFRPVGIVQAPDGSVVVSDWVDKSYPVHGKGRIWRIRGMGEAKAIPVIDSSITTDALKENLKDADRYVRSRSLRQLECTDEGLDAITKVMRFEKEPLARVTALNSLYKRFMEDRNKSHEDEAFQRAALLTTMRGFQADTPEIINSLDATHLRLQVPLLIGSGDPYKRAAIIERLVRDFTIEELSKWLGELKDKNFPHSINCLLVAIHRKDILQPCAKTDLNPFLRHPDPTVRQTTIRIIAEEKLSAYYPKLADALTVQPVTRELVETFVAAQNWIAFNGPVMKQEFDASKGVIQYLEDKKYPKAIRAQFLKLVDPASPKLKTATLLNWLAGEESPDTNQALKLLSLRSDPASRDFFVKGFYASKSDLRFYRAAMLRLSRDSTDESTEAFIDLADRDDCFLDSLRALQSAQMSDKQKQTVYSACEKQLHKSESPTKTFEIAEAATRLAVRQGFDAAKIAALGKHLPKRPTLSTDTAAWDKILSGPADAGAGERIFFHPNGAKCYACHRVQGKGAMVGPELSRIGSALKREKLIESILQPSKEIAPLFTAWQIATTDGKTRLGLIVSENFDSTVSVAGTDGKIERIKKLDIEEKKASAKSLMPDGLEKLLTLQEFRDLLAYLESLK